MPLYQYRCTNECCRMPVFEAMHPMAEAANNEDCPLCGRVAVRAYGVPHVKTDSQYVAMANTGGDQFRHPGVRAEMLRRAREAGVSTDGKVYDGRIAAFPGDPEAWVGSRDDVKAVIERRGWHCDGEVTVKGKDVVPNPTIPLAPDLIAEKVEIILEDQLGTEFTTASGPIVERAVEDVMNQYAQPAHLLKDPVCSLPQLPASAAGGTG